MFGKQIRLSRLTRNGKMLLIPLDHGVTDGPVKGLSCIFDIIMKVERGGATAILLHKGIIRSLKQIPNIGLIMHCSASTSLGPSLNYKVLVGTVEEAIRLGCDAVSVHINLGVAEEPQMLIGLSSLAKKCDDAGLPLLAMMYARGESIKNPFDPKIVAHVCRIGAELGADIVKTSYTGDVVSFREVVRSCPVPVIIAGGPKSENDMDVLTMAADAIQAGAFGVSFGRNVFEHRDPEAMVKALSLVVIEGKLPEEALMVMKQ